MQPNDHTSDLVEICYVLELTDVSQRKSSMKIIDYLYFWLISFRKRAVSG